MTKFERTFKKLCKAQGEVEKLTKELGEHIENNLGEGWFITHTASDGFLLLSPDAYNYKIATYFAVMQMEKEQAIEYIQSHPFN